ncbi:MAG TPA: D-sedoheptulose 7-phosphate isomerase [Terriglobia bacterium]|nr:D-sedoheptulose 7-phosphate isomerase [Terriglobia bacterium]
MKHAGQLIEQFVSESLRVKAQFFEENKETVAHTAETLAHVLRNGRKVLFFGNGGSAADAQHLAAELVGRFGPDRLPLQAISLSTDTSILTALANDYGYDTVFARQIAALGQAGDAAVAISTSGNSPNIIQAIDVARSKGLFTVGFTGETGGKMKDRVEVLFCVPSRQTPRIQETHILLGHILCELVDRQLFPEIYPTD